MSSRQDRPRVRRQRAIARAQIDAACLNRARHPVPDFELGQTLDLGHIAKIGDIALAYRARHSLPAQLTVHVLSAERQVRTLQAWQSS